MHVEVRHLMLHETHVGEDLKALVASFQSESGAPVKPKVSCVVKPFPAKVTRQTSSSATTRVAAGAPKAHGRHTSCVHVTFRAQTAACASVSRATSCCACTAAVAFLGKSFQCPTSSICL